MPVGSHTQPEQILDKNGKATTVHKGRGSAAPKAPSSRIRALAKTPKTAPQPLEKGVYFTDIDPLDGPTRYMITNVNGRTVDAVSDDKHDSGNERRFPKSEVVEALRSDAFATDIDNDQNYFWDSREDGEIVHYHNGFGEFVRGEIVTDSTGAKTMNPTALIGNWKSPSSRGRDGKIYYSHYAEGVLDTSEASYMRPNTSNMWESMSDEAKGAEKFAFIDQAGGDINNVPAIDFSLPDATPDEIYESRLHNANADFIYAVENYDIPDLERIAEVRRAADAFEAVLKERL